MEGKVALVTGGSRGLGAATCVALAEAGACVAINYCRQADAAREIQHQIEARGGRATVIQGDVAEEQDVQRMFTQCLDLFGALNILVNNAAINSDWRVEDMDVREWDRLMAVNLRGPFLCAKHAIAPMRRSGYGRIINLTSQGVRKGSVKHAHYATTKVGIIGFTRSLARELGR